MRCSRRIHQSERGVWWAALIGLSSDLDMSSFVKLSYVVPTIKISTKVDESAWNALKSLARESHRSISGLLTEAVQDYVRKRRIRPDVLRHLEDSIEQNEELGRRLAE